MFKKKQDSLSEVEKLIDERIKLERRLQEVQDEIDIARDNRNTEYEEVLPTSNHPARTYWYKETLHDSYGGERGFRVNRKEDGNLISSFCENGQHMPVIDIDYSADLVPSKTEGHFHLFLNKPVPWNKYLKVLEALADAGLIEHKFYLMAKQHSMSFVTAGTFGRFEELQRRIAASGVLFPDE